MHAILSTVTNIADGLFPLYMLKKEVNSSFESLLFGHKFFVLHTKAWKSGDNAAFL